MSEIFFTVCFLLDISQHLAIKTFYNLLLLSTHAGLCFDLLNFHYFFVVLEELANKKKDKNPRQPGRNYISFWYLNESQSDRLVQVTAEIRDNGIINISILVQFSREIPTNIETTPTRRVPSSTQLQHKAIHGEQT